MGTIPDYPFPARPLDGTEPLAGWQDGQQRSIPVAEVTAFARSDAATATEAAMAPLIKYAETRVEAAADAADIAADQAKEAKSAAGSVSGLLGREPTAAPGLFLIDEEDNVGPEVLTDQSTPFVALRDAVSDLRGDRFNPVQLVTEIAHGIIYGQSLSNGTSGGGAILTLDGVPGGVMMGTSPRPQDQGEIPSAWTGFVPLHEAIAPNASNLRETLSSGLVQRINERLVADYGTDLVGIGQLFLMSNPGQGGERYQALAASPYIDRLYNTVTRAADFAAAEGKSYSPTFFGLVQGEANQGDSVKEFYDAWLALFNGFQAHCDAVRGYARPLIGITYQTPSNPSVGWNVPKNALAQLQLTQNFDNWIMGGPIYHLSFIDNYHLRPAGYKQMGGHWGDALYDLLFDRYKRPALVPTVTRLSARRFVLRYPLRPGARITIDTTSLPEQVQKGIRLRPIGATDQVVEGEIALSSVRVTGIDRIEVVAAADVGSETHEFCTAYHGVQDGDRGYSNIRDTAGETLPVFDPAGLNVKLHNWACHSAVTAL